MRVVIDTNMFVSSFFGGNPRKVVEIWFSGRLTLCLSRQILKEYFGILNRFDIGDKTLLFNLISSFEKGYNSLFVASPKEQEWIPEDPADNKFIACAKALKADYIISGDSHLIRLRQIGKIKIATPVEMVDIVR